VNTPDSAKPQSFQAQQANQAQLQAEVLHLQEELKMRDQLVQQLSQELFRLVKGNADQSAQPLTAERDLAELQTLREQLLSMEQQVSFYQTTIADRDAEVAQLKGSVTDLTDRTEMLEKVVQELPNLYRQKFADRMAPVKEKVSQIQRENRKLHAELQSVSYRLAMKSRQAGKLDLPAFVEGEEESAGGLGLPSFG
jgi:predicted  nucleic acid-binding Zn-ribbon protein